MSWAAIQVQIRDINVSQASCGPVVSVEISQEQELVAKRTFSVLPGQKAQPLAFDLSSAKTGAPLSLRFTLFDSLTGTVRRKRIRVNATLSW